ncbi:MAG: hypothetical protein LBB89_02205 [Treponema sp.]|jgi:hypothetical protein|nr:hypothetical protein [Treponema sp.]
MVHEMVLESSPDYLNFKDTSFFPFEYNRTKIGMDTDEDNYPEIQTIEVPVVKRMLFQFKKPVPLEFS